MSWENLGCFSTYWNIDDEMNLIHFCDDDLWI